MSPQTRQRRYCLRVGKDLSGICKARSSFPRLRVAVRRTRENLLAKLCPVGRAPREERIMPIITTDKTLVTQINVFSVPPGGQDALIAYLESAAHTAREVDLR